MRITLNGTHWESPEPLTVSQLIECLGLAGQACAVEVNRTLTTKARHAQTQLADGDIVEVVTLVGGG